MAKKRKKLNPFEVEAAVNGIRKKYNDYMVEFMKPPAAKNLFEDRYIEALKARIDLDRFILDEIRLVQKLIDDEKERLRVKADKAAEKKRKKERRERNQKSVVDRIFEENRNKIRKYVSYGLEDDDVYDVDKLFGAVNEFEKKYWGGIEKILRKLYTSRYSGPRRELEDRLFELTLEGPGGYPPVMIKLKTILDRSPREYTALQREAQRCMMTISFFLHSVLGELEKIRNDETLEKDDIKTIEFSIDFLHNVINDFRLTDIKASKLKGGK